VALLLVVLAGVTYMVNVFNEDAPHGTAGQP
jgi:hypothetical protein